MAFYTSPGFSDERVWLYLATGLADAPEAEADEHERIEIVRWPLDQPRGCDRAVRGLEVADRLAVAAWRRARGSQRRGPRRAGANTSSMATHRRNQRFSLAPPGKPDARLPRLPRAGARPVPEHARGISIGSPAARRVPGPARTSTRSTVGHGGPAGLRLRARYRRGRPDSGRSGHAAAQNRLPALVLPPSAPRADPLGGPDRGAPCASLPGEAAEGAEPGRGADSF